MKDKKHKKKVKTAKITSLVLVIAAVLVIVGGVLWNNFGGSKSVAADETATETSVESTSEEVSESAAENSSAE